MNKIIPFMLLFFFISGTFTASFTPVSASELVEDSWNTKTLSPNPERQAFEVVTVEGKIYAIGGFYYTETPYHIVGSVLVENYLGTNERYDPVTDTWTALEPMPTPRVGFAITEYQGKIYCIGSSHMYSCVVEVYDPATDSWSTKADLPVPPYSHYMQAHVVDGKIFVRHITEVYVYDSNKDSWIKKTQIPNIDTRYPIISVVVDDKLVCFCVDEHDYPYDRPATVDVAIYDSKTDKWSEEKTHEIGLLEAGAWSGIMAAGTTRGVYAPKNVYVFGFKEGKYITWIYDFVKDVWSTAKAMPNMGVYGIAEVDDILYVFGHTANGELHMQYVPVGYDPRGYLTLSTATIPVASDGSSSSGSSESTLFRSFLTGYVVAVIVLTTVVATALFLFLYAKRRKKCSSERLRK